jgi:hypothetical protein
MAAGKKFLVFILCGAAAFIALPAAIYAARAPVLLLTDEPFNALYGVKRAEKARVLLSLRLFRRVKPVIVGENIGSDILVFSLEEASANPYCVLIPYRYAEGGRRYKETFPGVPVAILGVPGDILAEGAEAASHASGGESAVQFGVDLRTDLYRAGLCAAILSKGEGRILVYQDETPLSAERAALVAGLEAEAYTEEPRFLNKTQNISEFSNVSCVILRRPVQELLEQNLSIPMVLFSWLDPALTPDSAAVVFDDSPWAQAENAVKALNNKGEPRDFIPSKPVVRRDSVQDDGTVERLKTAAGRIPPRER